MNRATVLMVCFSISLMVGSLAACGGGGGGGGSDAYVAQELDLEAPSWIMFSNLAWDGQNFWAHSIYSDADSMIYAFTASGSQVGTFRNPLFSTHSIKSLEYGGGSL